jgi:hypothetical protein
MNANAVPLLQIFEKKLRLEVPLFQRQYVWSRENQWEPLWEDISRKFTEHLEGRKDAPVHFLGAMVLDQKQTPTTHVEKRQVIDGQQRLTTLQIFVSAFRDFCREKECVALADECESFTLNKGLMASPDTERFKVWPTQLDRHPFSNVILSGSRKALEVKHPLSWRKYARKPDPRPRIIEAYLFFYQQLTEFFLGSDPELPIAAEIPLATRLEDCFQSLKNALQVVVIDLDQGDDAQVIFETLNARGEPLLPADLLRNYIFLRAARANESPEALYERYWSRFDDQFWRDEVKQGRLYRPRSDLYLQHYLASRQGVEIPIKHLFVEYKFWISKERPFTTVQDEVAALARQGDHFRRMIAPSKSDILFPLMTFLDQFDVRTAYPMLLALLDAELPDSEWDQTSTVLESYLLRRAVCGLTTKNYNRIFLGLTRALRNQGTSAERVRAQLAALNGESTVWPDDEAFEEAWHTRHAYQTLQNPKIVHLLRRLSDTYLTAKHEQITIEGALTVEHILPQDWLDHWPLPDGSKGLTMQEFWTADPDDSRAQATRLRNAALQTLGNLTIVTQPLNSSVRNAAWEIKKPALLTGSLLPINQQLHSADHWDEQAIVLRSKGLFERALKIWPRPAQAG